MPGPLSQEEQNRRDELNGRHLCNKSRKSKLSQVLGIPSGLAEQFLYLNFKGSLLCCFLFNHQSSIGSSDPWVNTKYAKSISSHSKCNDSSDWKILLSIWFSQGWLCVIREPRHECNHDFHARHDQKKLRGKMSLLTCFLQINHHLHQR